MDRDDHLARAHKAARQAERWATVSMWGSGCALALYALAALVVLVVVGAVVWAVLAA